MFIFCVKIEGMKVISFVAFFLSLRRAVITVDRHWLSKKQISLQEQLTIHPFIITVNQ